jgi:hypothetical protein
VAQKGEYEERMPGPNLVRSSDMLGRSYVVMRKQGIGKSDKAIDHHLSEFLNSF